MATDLEVSKSETRKAFMSRGVLYRYFYEEFSNEFGEEKAAEVMKKAIYRWGQDKSEKYRELSENKDFKGVSDEFVKTSVCNGELFKPSVEKVDTKSTIINMENCPLVDAWKEMGLSKDEIIKMCDIAQATDYGKYEGMGFNLKIESTVANEGKCRLVLK